MKKLKAFSVSSMSILSREDMAQINGGDFTVYDCKSENVGKYCVVSFSGNTVTLGTCKYDVTTTASGFVYSYYCS